MQILYKAHWLIPWVILPVGMAAILKFARGYLGAGAFGVFDRRLVASLAGLMDLQATIGFIYFLWSGFGGHGFPAYRILHGMIMFGAALVTHLSSRWKYADDQTRFLNNFYIVLAAFLLMIVGLSLFPGGISDD